MFIDLFRLFSSSSSSSSFYIEHIERFVCMHPQEPLTLHTIPIHIYQHTKWDSIYVCSPFLKYSTLFSPFYFEQQQKIFILKYFNDKFFNRNTFYSPSFASNKSKRNDFMHLYCCYLLVPNVLFIHFLYLIQIINFFDVFFFFFLFTNRKTRALKLCWMRQSNPWSIHIACSTRFRMACGLLKMPWMSTIPRWTMHMLC